ncbi:MAG: hypothetical protein M1438_20255 [Deltaproteobacteria bacterium]|nr:hypothetical protein [Deltaproteobacteria bacterium]
MSIHAITRESASGWQQDHTLIEIIHQEVLEICWPISVDISITRFLSDIILESLLFRKEEWRLKAGEPSQINENEVIRLIRPSLVTLLSEAKTGSQNKGREHLLLIDVLSAIHKLYCRIWPLCE